MPLHVETAGVGDAEEIVALRDRIASWLLDRGVRQWLPGEMTAERLRPWLAAGQVHMVRHQGRIVATVAVLSEDEDVWWVQDEPAGCVHLLMVDRAHAEPGLGRRLLGWAERHVWARGDRIVRLDAVLKNTRLRAWYRAAGYREVSTKHFDRTDWCDAVLLERRLQDEARSLSNRSMWRTTPRAPVRAISATRSKLPS